MSLLLPVDGCPECVRTVAHPWRVTSDGTSDGIVAHYRCPGCRHSWWTTWHISALDLPCPGCPACNSQEGAA